MLVEATPTMIGRWQGNLIICLINQLYTHTMYTFYPEDRTQHFAYTRQIGSTPLSSTQQRIKKTVLLDGG